MVTDMGQVPIAQSIQEEINAVDTAVGWAIMDSGATRSVCGEATWNQINEYLLMRELSDKVDSKGESRDFRFGDGAVVRSKVSVTIPVCVAKSWKELKLHVLPGETPLLLARASGWNCSEACIHFEWPLHAEHLRRPSGYLERRGVCGQEGG